MSIEVKTTNIPTNLKLHVTSEVNGENQKKVVDLDSSTFEIEGDKATVIGKKFGAISNKLEVKDGQKIEITSKKTVLLTIAFVIVFTNLLATAVPTEYRWPIYILSFIIILISYNFIPTYQIKLLPIIPDRYK